MRAVQSGGSAWEGRSGCALRIVDEGRAPLGTGRVGEIAIRSTSMFEGYRNRPDDTGRALAEGWSYSGDLGFEWEGEYYVVGRKKDFIIVAGNNVCPEDIEDEVGRVAASSRARHRVRRR